MASGGDVVTIVISSLLIPVILMVSVAFYMFLRKRWQLQQHMDATGEQIVILGADNQVSEV